MPKEGTPWSVPGIHRNQNGRVLSQRRLIKSKPSAGFVLAIWFAENASSQVPPRAHHDHKDRQHPRVTAEEEQADDNEGLHLLSIKAKLRLGRDGIAAVAFS